MNYPELPAVLDRRKLVYTYSILNNYRNVCPHQTYRRYVKRDLPYVETDAMRFGNEVHAAFEHRIGAGKPLPESMRQWECFASPFDGLQARTELKLGMLADGAPADYWAKDVWLRGKLDLVVIQDVAAYMNDLKTGSSRYEDPFELEIGALLLHANNPQLTRISGTYTWLKENRVGQMYDLSDTKKTYDEVSRLVAEIESSDWEKKPNGLCKAHCDVLDCQHNGRRA